MLDYWTVKNWSYQPISHRYTRRDTMLYALGIGFGADPLDARQLRFVYEKDLRVVPSMAAVLGADNTWLRDPKVGIDWVKLVHGEQRIEVHSPLPVEAELTVSSRMVALIDKGAGKGAIAVIDRDLHERGSGTLLARSSQTLFLRGDGGFSEHCGCSDPPPARLPPVPAGTPDAEEELASLEQSALIYRLSGDYNPLHVDPEVAHAAGFPRPILHGLCTFGMAMHAVLKAYCEYDTSRVKSLAARFTAPVYPGESIKFQFWRVNDRLHLRARVDARDVIVLDNGIADIAPI